MTEAVCEPATETRDAVADADPGIAAVLNSTGDPASGLAVAAVALTPCVPLCVPSVQPIEVATPNESVETVAPASEPPPEATENVTGMPGTPFPNASTIRTDGGEVTADATRAVCETCELELTAAGAAAVTRNVSLSESWTPLADARSRYPDPVRRTLRSAKVTRPATVARVAVPTIVASPVESCSDTVTVAG